MNETDLLPLIEWLKAHPNWILISVFLISLIESLALAGIIVPGVLLLFLVSALAGHLDLPAWGILLSGFIGAVSGDGISFFLGHYFKGSLRQTWPFSRYPKTLALGERFFLKHGGKSIFIGRFVGPIRPVLPLIAGMLGMSQLRFTLFNALSALLWAPFYILPGYLTGKAANVVLPEHFYGILIGMTVSLVLLAWTFRFMSLNLQHNSQLYDALIVKQESSAIFNFVYRILTTRRPNVLQHHVELPLASFSLLLFSIIFFVLWSFLTLETRLLTNLDQILLTFSTAIRDISVPIIDGVLIRLTLLGDEGFLYLSFSIFVIAMLLRKQFYAAACITSAGLSTALITHALKAYFAIPRPELVLSPPSSFAYPSGHSSGSTVLYGLMASFIAQGMQANQRWKCYLCFSIPIVLIAFSRVLLGVHWFSDVIGGMTLGLIICSISRVVYSYYWFEDCKPAIEKSSKNQTDFIFITCLISWFLSIIIYQQTFFEETLLRFQAHAF